jgi:hypothetical protein
VGVRDYVIEREGERSAQAHTPTGLLAHIPYAQSIPLFKAVKT